MGRFGTEEGSSIGQPFQNPDDAEVEQAVDDKEARLAAEIQRVDDMISAAQKHHTTHGLIDEAEQPGYDPVLDSPLD